ncbi:YadA family autotransporter adhesin, partial [Pseudomonas sp. BN515]|uniref:YadA family autotransporter adhesin n=1 Tax=Pseudomonas sp. BN515 TaxID=2567892 RepID=UPI0024548D71
GDVTNLKGDVTNLDGRVTHIYDTGTKYFHANSTGTDSVASGADSVAIGMGAVASHDGSIALGAGSVADGSTLGHEAYLVGGTARGEVNIGDRRMTGLSAGADDTDAVNVAQLKSITSSAVADSVMYDNSTHNRITLGGPTYNRATRTGGTKITNVARGEDDSDAVNMSQLNETNAKVTNIDGRVTTIEGSVTSINNGGGIKYFHANSAKADSVASGADSVAVGPKAQASGKGAIAMGEGASATADGSLALGQGASDNGRGAESYTGKYSNAANASVGTVSVGNAATGETRTISNVADGKEATDAVNLRQLDGAVAESKQYTDDSIHNVNTAVANVTTHVSNLDNRVTRTEGDVSKLQNGTDGMFQVNNTSNLPKPRATGTDSVAGGAGAAASGGNSAAIGTRSRASGQSATAVGNDAHAKADNSVALGANSVADRANSVSVGSAGNERQVTNVAAGSAPTDAVNVSQLQQSMGDISNQFYDYTDSRYSALRQDLKKQDDILSAGIAGAMAMATLPQPYAPGASMATVGLGNYRGQGALAIGVSKISDNGKWVTKLQGSTSSQGDTGVAVGIGYQW